MNFSETSIRIQTFSLKKNAFESVICKQMTNLSQPQFNSSRPGQNGCHFGRWQFQMHFPQWKLQSSNSNFTDICSQGCNCQWASVSSGNGLSPLQCQAVIWTNADPIHWRIYAALGGDELRHWGQDTMATTLPRTVFNAVYFFKIKITFWFYLLISVPEGVYEHDSISI